MDLVLECGSVVTFDQGMYVKFKRDTGAAEFIDTFLRPPFSNEERHARRIAQLAEYETTGAIAGHEIDA